MKIKEKVLFSSQVNCETTKKNKWLFNKKRKDFIECTYELHSFAGIILCNLQTKHLGTSLIIIMYDCKSTYNTVNSFGGFSFIVGNKW